VRSLLVVEFLPAVIGWHERGLAPLGPELTSDPRCRLVQGDFFALSNFPGFDSVTPDRRFHAILLDIDHSPNNLIHAHSGGFYTPDGLRALATRLHPGGVFAMWSDEPPDEDFQDLLRGAFAETSTHVVSFPNPLLDRESRSTVYLAQLAK
jgi:spermidine synthase